MHCVLTGNCVLCRKKVEPPSEKEIKAHAKAAEHFRRDRRGIFVKRFDEVPVADVEIVFPDKEIGLKLLDKLILGATALSAVLGCLWAVIRNAVELSVLLSIATTFGGKLYQVLSWLLCVSKAELATWVPVCGQ